MRSPRLARPAPPALTYCRTTCGKAVSTSAATSTVFVFSAEHPKINETSAPAARPAHLRHGSSACRSCLMSSETGHERRVAAEPLPGSASAVLASGVRFLQPQEAVLDAMLAGRAAPQRSRLLAGHTIEQRALHVCRFVAFTNDYP